MDRKLFRSLLLLITFMVALILAIVKFDAIWDAVAGVLGVFKPLFIGLAIAFVLNRPCAFFRRHFDNVLGKTKAARLSIPLAVTLSYLILFAAIAAIFAFVIPQLVASIELFLSNLSGYTAQVQGWINELVTRFHFEQLDLSKVDDTLKNIFNGALTALTQALPHVLSLTSGIVSVVITGTLSFVFSIYMLAGKDKLLSQCRRVLKAYAPAKLYGGILDVIRLSAGTFTKFVSGQLTEACILGMLCFIGMTLFRFHYAPLISVLIGVLALIPIVGAYVGAVTSALLLAMISPVEALWFLVFLITLQQVEGNVIYPRVVGTSIGLPGIWVLTAVTVGGGLFGFVGMLLSVPVASILYTLLRRDVHKRLSPEKPVAE